MKHIYLTTGAAVLMALGACSAADTTQAAKDTASQVQKTATSKAETTADFATLFSGAPAGTYEVEKNHAYIMFSYLHQGYSKPVLSWSDWDSTMEWNPSDPESSSVNVSIKADKIDSAVPVFDDHLRDGQFFDTANHPLITFKSTNLEYKSGTSGVMTGDLTMKGITKPVSLDVTFNKAGANRGGGHKLGFSATGQIMRSDWDLGLYKPAISDEVDLVIEVEYVRPE